MQKNKLRELLNNGQPSLGTRLESQWPTMIEVIGHTGMFDYVELAVEYAPYSLFSLDNVGRAIELFDHMTGMIKIEQESRMHLAVRGLSAGIQNLLFSDVRSVADVEECVKAVRAETPEIRGLHGARHGRDVGIFIEAGTPAFVQALDDAVIALMIEKKEAIENLEDMLAVKGVDMVQFGPADYSMSIGKVGQKKHPEVVEAHHYMIKTALKMNVAPRVEIGDADQAEEYLNMGVRHFAIGTDVSIVYNFCKDNGTRMRDTFNTL